MRRILVIGDVHAPWVNYNSYTEILKIAKKLKPTDVIQMGDLYDMFSYARFAGTVNLMTPKQELNEGREFAEKFWENIKKAIPDASLYQLIGNHDERVMARVFEKFPQLESLIDIRELWKFQGVNTVTSQRDELIIDDVIYMHGYRSKLGDHAKYNLKSTVCGHSHRGGVVFIPLMDKVIFELNAGYIGDRSAIPLSYTKQKKITTWTQGYGFIDEHGPRFCPLKNE